MDKLYISQNTSYEITKYESINNNVLVCGAPGTGKTRNIVIPNLLKNINNSFVINDSKGMIYKKYKSYFLSKGFDIKQVDFVNLQGHYNIFQDIKTDFDILKISHLITYMDSNPNADRDPFWDEESELMFSAYISFMKEFLVPEKQNLGTLNDLIADPEPFINDIDETIQNTPNSILKDRIVKHFNIPRATVLPSDKLFFAALKKNPDSFAVRQYRKVCTSPEKTFGTVLATTLSKLGVYDTKELREFTRCSDINFSDIGQKKTAFFVSVSDNDRTMDTLANILYSQIIQSLVASADKNPDGRLNIDVDLYFDDFATSVKIVDFPRMIASFRSRGISSVLLLQSESQLFSLYNEDAKTIIGSSGTYCYLGNMDTDTIRNISFRMNMPVNDIIALPQNKLIVHRQGNLPVVDKCLNVEEIEKAVGI